jgi:hypothetical protein
MRFMMFEISDFPDVPAAVKAMDEQLKRRRPGQAT